MTRLPRSVTRLALMLALGGTALQVGCYGPFALTRKLHAWNGTIGDRWINSLLFFGLAVVQVYTICLLGDGLIFNTVEFWSGSNPVTRVDPDGSIHIVDGDRTFDLIPSGEDRWNLVRDGELVAVASRLPDGALALSDVASQRSTVVTAGQLGELVEGAAAAVTP